MSFGKTILNRPGVLRDAHQITPRLVQEYAGSIVPPVINEFEDCINVSDSQGQTNACAAFAWCNRQEMLIRKFADPEAFAPDLQLDAMAVYRHACAKRGKGYTGGLYLNEPFESMREMGIIPPSALAMPVGTAIEELSIELSLAPVVCGLSVNSTWLTPTPESGEIRLSNEPGAGHALCIVDLHERGGFRWLTLANSWGPRWGWHGLCVIEVSHFQSLCLAQPMTYICDPLAFRTHDGWRNHLVRKP